MSKFMDLIDRLTTNEQMKELGEVMDKFFMYLKSKDKQAYEEGIEKIEELVYKIDEPMAKKLVSKMQPRGEYISYEDVGKFLKEKGIMDNHCTWYLVMNMYANDSYDTMEKYAADDKENFLFHLSKDFIYDEDAEDNKVGKYFLD